MKWLFLLILLPLKALSWECSETNNRMVVSEHWDTSDIVVLAKVLEGKVAEDKEGVDYMYKLEALHLFKGSKEKIFRLGHIDTIGSGGLSIGSSYVLFLDAGRPIGFCNFTAEVPLLTNDSITELKSYSERKDNILSKFIKNLLAVSEKKP